jgi:hypothetical protein
MPAHVRSAVHDVPAGMDTTVQRPAVDLLAAGQTDGTDQFVGILRTQGVDGCRGHAVEDALAGRPRSVSHLTGRR